LFSDAKNIKLEGMISKGYDHYLTAFDAMLPSLFSAYNSASDSV